MVFLSVDSFHLLNRFLRDLSPIILIGVSLLSYRVGETFIMYDYQLTYFCPPIGGVHIYNNG